MQNCLGKLNMTYCLIYLDDLIVFSKTEEEHLHCLCTLCLSTSESTTWSSSQQSVSSSRARLTIWLIMSPRRALWPSRENLKAMAEFTHPELTWKSEPFWLGGALQVIYQRVCMHSAAIAQTSIWGRCSWKRCRVPLQCLKGLASRPLYWFLPILISHSFCRPMPAG